MYSGVVCMYYIPFLPLAPTFLVILCHNHACIHVHEEFGSRYRSHCLVGDGRYLAFVAPSGAVFNRPEVDDCCWIADDRMVVSGGGGEKMISISEFSGDSAVVMSSLNAGRYLSGLGTNSRSSEEYR